MTTTLDRSIRRTSSRQAPGKPAGHPPALTRLHASDAALVRNAVRACNAQLGLSSLGATRFRQRADRFLAGERMEPFELRAFRSAVQAWTTGRARLTVPRADLILLARRAFALVGHVRTYGRGR